MKKSILSREIELPETMDEVLRLFTPEEVVRFVQIAYQIDRQCELRSFANARRIARSIAARKGWATRRAKK